MPAHKEPRFFALNGKPFDYAGPGDQTRFSYVTELADYKAYFEGAEGYKAIGEASPWYLYVESAPALINRLIPEVNLIAFLRDPVERAYSNFLHARIEGLEPLASFSEAMAAEEERIAANWSPRFHYKSKGLYFQQIERYLEYFDRNQLRFYLHEDLSQQPEKLFRDLFAFIGADPSFRVDTRKRHNQSRVPKSATLHRILKQGNALTSLFRYLLPHSLKAVFKNRIFEANLKPKPELSPEERSHFVAYYKDDILKLERFLDRDLSAWLA